MTIKPNTYSFTQFHNYKKYFNMEKKKKGLFDKFRETAEDIVENIQEANTKDDKEKGLFDKVFGRKDTKEDEKLIKLDQDEKKKGGLFDRWFGGDDEEEAQKRSSKEEDAVLEEKMKKFEDRNDEDDDDDDEKEQEAEARIANLETKFADILKEMRAKHEAIREKLASEHLEREQAMAAKLEQRLQKAKDRYTA